MFSSSVVITLKRLLLALTFRVTFGSWEEWWTYEGISGPNYWGLLNPEWSLCNMGHRQSPVDIDPSILLFDPHLRPVDVEKNRVSK
ncbi:putative carbonic anhydrase-like protein 2 [Limulus polyphemus]|uniref:Carbonic anhydrase-like protein 2 n=1 Tax=Limulus polyphemus TaxID=6850 RepID=A0ABM1TS00_LIMPO|nr:putative carbonic anhydrase-like protein 2 [Limulus polyphemus]